MITPTVGMVLIIFPWRITGIAMPLQWRHNGHDGVSNHQSYHCLLNCLFRRRSKKTSKLRVTGLCEGNSLVGEFPAQRDSNAENVSIWWRHDVEARSYVHLCRSVVEAILSLFALTTSGHRQLTPAQLPFTIQPVFLQSPLINAYKDCVSSTLYRFFPR